MTDPADVTSGLIRDAVQARYAAAARDLATPSASSAASADPTDSCCGTSTSVDLLTRDGIFGHTLYAGGDADQTSATALAASLGCGVPTAVADLHVGETVLDLGSGAGADVLISARRVGPTGRVIGLDMTPEMIDLARRNAADAEVDNVEFVEGYLEQIPLSDASVDVVISNCVINLAADKSLVLAQALRVLRPGGRLAISDVVALAPWPQDRRDEVEQWTGCISGALLEDDYRSALAAAGFVEVDIERTHQVHELAAAAVIRARRPE